MTPNEAWMAAYHQLEHQLDRTSFDTWLRTAKFIDYDSNTYVISVPNTYARDMCQQRLYRNIHRVLSDIAEENCEIRFVLEKEVHQDSNQEDSTEDKPPFIGPDTLPQFVDFQRDPEQDQWHFFAKVPEAIVDTLPPGPGWLMVKFIRYINRATNTLIRNLDQLAEMFNISERTVRRHIKELVEAGHLIVIAGRGRGSANTYHLAGQLAVAVCGPEVAQQTASQIKRQLAQKQRKPKQAKQSTPEVNPEPQSDDKTKSGQNDRLNEDSDNQKAANLAGQTSLKVDKLTEQTSYSGQIDRISNKKGGQNGRPSATKSGQIVQPIQTLTSLPEKKNLPDKLAPAIEESDTQIPPATQNLKQIIHLPDKSKSKSNDLPRYPTLAAWVKEWGGPSPYQVAALKNIDSEYDQDDISEALASTIKAYNSGSITYTDRLPYLQRTLQQRTTHRQSANV